MKSIQILFFFVFMSLANISLAEQPTALTADTIDSEIDKLIASNSVYVYHTYTLQYFHPYNEMIFLTYKSNDDLACHRKELNVAPDVLCSSRTFIRFYEIGKIAFVATVTVLRKNTNHTVIYEEHIEGIYSPKRIFYNKISSNSSFGEWKVMLYEDKINEVLTPFRE